MFVPRNLEDTLNNMEDSFWYILNNPQCYCTLLYKFFDKSSAFRMFPHIEAFWRNAKIAEVAEVAKKKARDGLKEQGNALLEEIQEDENEFDNKRGEFLKNLLIWCFRIYILTVKKAG